MSGALIAVEKWQICVTPRHYRRLGGSPPGVRAVLGRRRTPHKAQTL